MRGKALGSRHPGLVPESTESRAPGYDLQAPNLPRGGPRHGAAATGGRFPARPGTAGFTLVEVMISLLIFGLLAAAGVALLSFSVRAQGVTAAKLDQDTALARLSSALSADLAQAVPRRTRDEGGAPLPLFTGESGSGASPVLRFVRGGWSNLDGAARAGAQKVEYRVEQGALLRVAYPMLDGAAPLPGAAMLDRVAQVSLRYRTRGAWSDRWVGTPEAPLPDALELRIAQTGASGGVVEYRQLYLVGTGYGKRADAAK